MKPCEAESCAAKSGLALGPCEALPLAFTPRPILETSDASATVAHSNGSQLPAHPDVVSPSARPSPLRLHGATAPPPGNGIISITRTSYKTPLVTHHNPVPRAVQFSKHLEVRL